MSMTRRHIRIPRVGKLITPVGEEFVAVEALSGIVVIAGAVAALVWFNVAPGSYEDLWTQVLTIGSGQFAISLDLRHWLNDGLMAIFFFVVGLEIKRELVRGELRNRRAAAVPVFAAIGGMVLPAAIYLALNLGTDAADGWGVPIATDIALAVGVLSVLGSFIPSPLRLFLLTLAIVDDIGAIVVIAIFYSRGINGLWLAGAVAMVLVFVALQRLHVAHPLAYVIPAIVLWVCTYQSGVHATIAGVILGLLTPANPFGGRAVLEQLETRLHPFTSFLIVPLFALANAGVELSRTAFTEAASSRVAWGIALGLVFGKLFGVVGATAAVCRFGGGQLPEGVAFRHIVGAGALAGIGFTVSLFIADLTFIGPRLAYAKIAILIASLVAALIGTVVLVAARRSPRNRLGAAD
jgi:NhaA family Na+:H+ antiporter